MLFMAFIRSYTYHTNSFVLATPRTGPSPLIVHSGKIPRTKGITGTIVATIVGKDYFLFYRCLVAYSLKDIFETQLIEGPCNSSSLSSAQPKATSLVAYSLKDIFETQLIEGPCNSSSLSSAKRNPRRRWRWQGVARRKGRWNTVAPSHLLTTLRRRPHLVAKFAI